MIDELGGRVRLIGTAALIAASMLFAVGAARPAEASAVSPPASSVGAPQLMLPWPLSAGQTAALGAAASKSTVGARARLSSRLATLSLRAVRTAARPERARRLGLPASGPGSLLQIGSDVVVDARTKTTEPAQVEALRSAGGRVLAVSPELRTITVAVAPEGLVTLAAVPGVEVVTPELTPVTAAQGSVVVGAAASCGSATSEADQQLHAADARDAFGVSGAGVKVGVISDSYDVDGGDSKSAADDIASGDLPGVGNPCGHATPVQVLAEGTSGSDEGRAMLQVVHDLAPGSSLSFATATPESAFPSRVAALRAAGARVIVDDVGFFDEPYFQDGPQAVAANTASANGTAYYSSAGNNNLIVGGVDRASWEAPSYRPMACPLPDYLSCMNVGTGASPADLQPFDVIPGGQLIVDLQWSEPWFGVSTDIDAFLLDESFTFIRASDDANTGPGGTQKPFEFLSVINASATTRRYYLLVAKYDGASNPRLRWTLLQPQDSVVGVSSLAAGDLSGPSIFGHSAAPGAMSIGAVPFDNSAQVETYSSRDPVVHYFGPVNGTTSAAALGTPQTLAKPDLAATDGAQTTFFGGSGPPFRFFGTSEAAPHAAAIAALEMEARPGASVAAVQEAQKITASPVGAFGAAADGAGLANALGAIARLKNGQGPTVATGGASGVGSSNATLSGTVNPQGFATSYHFEYGTTTAYGSVTPDAAAGNGLAAIAASATLTDLVPASTYHYRLAAANGIGASSGADGTFTTGVQTVSAGPPIPPPRTKPQPPAAKPKVKLTLRGLTLRITISGGTFRNAAVAIKSRSRTVAKGSGRPRNGKLTIHLKRRLKKGRYAVTVVLTDAKSKKTTVRSTLKV